MHEKRTDRSQIIVVFSTAQWLLVQIKLNTAYNLTEKDAKLVERSVPAQCRKKEIQQLNLQSEFRLASFALNGLDSWF